MKIFIAFKFRGVDKDVLESQGVAGHVFYSLNAQSPRDFRRAMNLFLK